MKKIPLLILLFLFTGKVFGQSQYATTSDGKTVILKADGTWVYASMQPAPINRLKASKSNSSHRPTKSRKQSTKSSSRTYIRGPRGGCYYINGNGGKTYVDRSKCN